MARQVGVDAVIEALGRVKYPGYAIDIVNLGLIEDVAATGPRGISLTIRQASEREEVTKDLSAAIHRELAHGLGIDQIELRVHRLEPEMGEKTGKVTLEGIKHIVAVASGKGGVGKSTVAANLAVALSKLGFSVGLLDADIYGPSVPTLFGVQEERPKAAGGGRFHPIEKFGVKLVSIGFFLTDKAPVIWRGPMVMSAVRQFLKEVIWGELDYLIVDLPPGTGDAQLTLAQQVYLDGVVVVTTPQDLALLDAQRAVKMFRQLHCPLLGVVENMSFFVCPDCGERGELFGRGGGERMAVQEGIKLLVGVPIFAELREGGDSGTPVTAAQPEHPASQAFARLAQQVVSQMHE
ncbi:MAG: Mrp/NBP35 family ATP-binding protein [Candidatus Binataceae bacterium]|jgi:ATP-binding protein involved in chromosome partitioning